MALLIGQCPTCGGPLAVQKLWCPECEIALEGTFELGVLARLSPEQQRFIAEFVKASGSLKEMGKKLQVSYPTMRNRLDSLIAEIRELEKAGERDE